MNYGGKGHRRGRGVPKGYRRPATIAKEAARELARQIIMEDLRPLLKAQMAQALGLKYLVVRNKATGQFVRVAEAGARARAGLKSKEEIIEVWEKDPSTEAAKELLNRCLDKSADQPFPVEHSGGITLSWLD